MKKAGKSGRDSFFWGVVKYDIREKLAVTFLNLVIPATIIIGLGAGIASCIPTFYPTRVAAISIFSSSGVIAYIIKKKKHPLLAAKVLMCVTTLSLVFAVLINGGVMAPAYLGLTFTLTFMSLLFSRRTTVMFLAFMIAIGGISLLLTSMGLLPRREVPPPLFYWICYSVLWTAIGAALISGSRMLQNALEESTNREHLLNSIFRSIDDALITVNSDLTPVHTNEAADDFLERLQLSKADALSDIFFDDNDISSTNLKDLIRKNSFNINGCRMRLCDNKETKWYLISSAPITQNNIIVGAVILLRDVTDITEQEAALAQSQKLDAVGQLASGIAHDFNNMLAGIMGASDLLRYNLPPKNMQCREYVSTITESAKRAAELANSLLHFSQSKPVDRKAVSLHAIIDKTITLLEKTTDKRIEIQTNLTAESSNILADATQIQNVLLNFGINACHAMPDGGQLCIATENTIFTDNQPQDSQFSLKKGQYLQIKISDTGTGIDPDVLPRIFEPFFTTKAKGSGLGLSSAYATVKQHDGSITVDTHKAEGTCFTILLPTTTEKIAVAQSAPPKISSGEGTILLIEDEFIIRNSNAKLLARYGYEVICAEDGQQGLDIFTKQHNDIDLVVMDMIMPKMNGHDCFFEMKKISPDVKVLLSTGYAENENIHHMTQNGLSDIIYKPFTCEDLCQKINAIINASATNQPI